MPWLLFAAGTACFWAVGRALKLPRATVGALVLTGALANTLFVGLPMIKPWCSREYLGVGIVIDQLGSYLVLSTLGILVAGLCRGGAAAERPDLLGIVRKIAKFMPFLALVAALLLRPVAYPDWLSFVLGRLADTRVPLALVSVGFQLRLSQFRGRVPVPLLGLGFKLVVGPWLMLLILVGLLGQAGPVIRVTVSAPGGATLAALCRHRRRRG